MAAVCSALSWDWVCALYRFRGVAGAESGGVSGAVLQAANDAGRRFAAKATDVMDVPCAIDGKRTASCGQIAVDGGRTRSVDLLCTRKAMWSGSILAKARAGNSGTVAGDTAAPQILMQQASSLVPALPTLWLDWELAASRTTGSFAL